MSVDTIGTNLSAPELWYLVHRCPNLRSVRLKYIPEDQQVRQFEHRIHLAEDWAEEEFTHLHELASLENLRDVSFISSDFYGHQVSTNFSRLKK